MLMYTVHCSAILISILSQINMCTRLACEAANWRQWPRALGLWAAAVRFAARDQDGIWTATKEAATKRLGLLVGGIARALLHLGEASQLAAWVGPGRVLGLPVATGWGLMGAAHLCLVRYDYVAAIPMLEEVGQEYAHLPGGPNEAHHWATATAHKMIRKYEAGVQLAGERERQAEAEAGLQRSDRRLDELLPEVTLPSCPDCRGWVDPTGRHACTATGRLGYGARRWGSAHRDVVAEARHLAKCDIGLEW